MIERARAVAQNNQAPPIHLQNNLAGGGIGRPRQVSESEERLYEVTLIAGFPFDRW